MSLETQLDTIEAEIPDELGEGRAAARIGAAAPGTLTVGGGKAGIVHRQHETAHPQQAKRLPKLIAWSPQLRPLHCART